MLAFDAAPNACGIPLCLVAISHCLYRGSSSSSLPGTDSCPCDSVTAPLYGCPATCTSVAPAFSCACSWGRACWLGAAGGWTRPPTLETVPGGGIGRETGKARDGETETGTGTQTSPPQGAGTGETRASPTARLIRAG